MPSSSFRSTAPRWLRGRFCRSLFLALATCVASAMAQSRSGAGAGAAVGSQTGHKPRIIVTTDLGADPDDEQSLVRLLVSANEFDIEGLIVSTSCWKKNQATTAMLDRIVEAYGRVLPNLKVHAPGYPTSELLKTLSVLGQTGYGMGDVGDGRDTRGSELIIAAVDKADPRPVWVQFWGGGNTLAQAIWKVRATRTQGELATFLSKLRVFDILGQDEAGAWIARNFPDVFFLRATVVYGWQPPKNGPYQRNEIQSRGPLGAVYPDTKWATEGDTPAFLHVFPNGLNDPEKIDQGGWGGRFALARQAGIRSMPEVARINPQAESQYDPYLMHGNTAEGVPAQRWSKGYDNDFAARMVWSITSRYQDANHPPLAVVNGDTTRKPLEISVTPGSTVRLDATGSSDPDKDALTHSWFFYKEPGSYDGEVRIQNAASPVATVSIPSDAAKCEIHVIMELRDDGSPNLHAYRRIILHVK